MSRPIIGITTGVGPFGTEDESHDSYMSYAKAIEDAGGDYVFLDPKPDLTADDLKEMLSRIDGLLLSGGRDVHPSNYNSRTEPGDASLSIEELIAAYGMNCDPLRDALEIPLTRAAYVKGMPILGICRGFQVFNVALGGSLVKDIRTGHQHKALPKDETGIQPSASHSIELLKDSRLYEIVGSRLKIVNSRHHQGVTAKEKSTRLRAVAFTQDGLIEGLEGLGHPWATAVQWHPERQADDYVYTPCKALFRAFVTQATCYSERG